MRLEVFIAGFITISSSVSAQTPRARDPFRIPDNSSRCERLDATETSAGNLGFRFDFAENSSGDPAADDRLVDVEFDSVGVPKGLFIVQLDAVAVVFEPDGRTRVLSLSLAKPDSGARARSIGEKPIPRFLEPSDAGRARAFAEWLWTHRCLKPV